MSSGVVDVCLIPEVPFSLDKLCDYVQSVMDKKVCQGCISHVGSPSHGLQGHAVICVAEGAGQDLLGGADSGATDASGNPILKDIGLFLKDSLKTKLKV